MNPATMSTPEIRAALARLNTSSLTPARVAERAAVVRELATREGGDES